MIQEDERYCSYVVVESNSLIKDEYLIVGRGHMFLTPALGKQRKEAWVL